MIPEDKWLHFGAGAGAFIPGYVIARLWGCTKDEALLWGFLGSSLLSAVKELVWDLALRRGRPELADFVFGELGAGTATFLFSLTF